MGIAATACSSSSKGHTSSTTAALTPADKLVEQGLAAEQAGNNAQAIADYTAATASNPSDKIAFYDLGVVYQSEGNVASAEGAYQKALTIDPKYSSALFNLAILYTNTNPTQAVALYRQLLALRPNDSNVLFNLGLLLEKVGSVAEGRSDVAKAVQLNPSLKSRVPPGALPNTPPTT